MLDAVQFWERPSLPEDVSMARAALLRFGYVRMIGCVSNATAEGAYAELLEDPRYEHADGAAEGLGIVSCRDGQLSEHVRDCCHLLTGPVFKTWLTSLIGKELKPTKAPSLFKMQLGDHIDVHDDCSDQPKNCLSAVLHFSKDWKRSFGGNTVIGPVKRIEMTCEPDGCTVRRWIFSRNKSVISPVFNSLVLIALKQGMAHGVTAVRTNRPRLSIVATYDSVI